MRSTVALLVIITTGLVSGSAIPMWEFLSRGEKMSHLFNMFVKQVEDHCDQSSMPDCNKVLMVYGLTNLAKMDDDSLDKMDPYQRGAQDIIWDSMMKGTYKNPSSASTPSPSRRTEGQDIYSDSMDAELSDGGNGLGSSSQDQEDVSQYVIGPMVVRVMPDGSPVPGDSERPLPRDEDAEEYRLMRGQRMPSLEELQRSRGAERGSQQRQRGPAPTPSPDHDRSRYQSGLPASLYSRHPHLTASQPHAKFALPPPGINFRIASRSQQ